MRAQTRNHETRDTRDSFSLISYAGCLGLSPVNFGENSLFKCASQLKIAKNSPNFLFFRKKILALNLKHLLNI